MLSYCVIYGNFMLSSTSKMVQRKKIKRFNILVASVFVFAIAFTLLFQECSRYHIEGGHLAPTRESFSFIRETKKTEIPINTVPFLLSNATRKKSQSKTWTLPIKPIDKVSLPSHWTSRKREQILLTLSTMKLPELDKSFRNPCWYDWYSRKAVLRCFPYFYIAGFPKCGTTDLYSRLVSHPLIIAGSSKENHYLTILYYSSPQQRRCPRKLHCGSYLFSRNYFTQAAAMISLTNDANLMNSTFLWKAKHNLPSLPQVKFIEAFPRESRAIWKQGQEIWKYPGITVDASASTAADLRHFKHIAENVGYDFPRNTTADWIRKIHPDTKIIMILRDPVARAYSDYVMRVTRRNMQPSASDFHNRAQESIRVMETCLEAGTSPLVCTSDNLSGNVHTGLYYHHIKSWFEKFPRDQIFIIRFEDYINNVTHTLAKVFKFLDLPAVSEKGLEFIGKSEALNTAQFQGEMYEETRTLLAKFYKPFNEMLADLMDDKRYLWNEH